MARNDPDAADWIEPEEAPPRDIPPWRKDDGKSHRRQREPMNWPTAAVGVAALVALVVVAWICGGVATEWISR